MKLDELKAHLTELHQIAFELPDGSFVPAHFHVTEVGSVSKTFIDCGGKLRLENSISLQLWNANDYDHRLHPDKLIQIIDLSVEQLSLGNGAVQVEYQGATTLESYDLDFNGKHFVLKPKFTACLAEDACGIPPQPKQKVSLADLTKSKDSGSSCCPPGCC